MNAFAERRARRLAEALSAVSKPLAPLLEYADYLEKHVTEDQDTEVLCIAALLRVRAVAAKRDITACLEALELAASRMIEAETYYGGSVANEL
jgi:hypothetical protein